MLQWGTVVKKCDLEYSGNPNRPPGQLRKFHTRIYVLFLELGKNGIL
jgi:hypothetical protein